MKEKLREYQIVLKHQHQKLDSEIEGVKSLKKEAELGFKESFAHLLLKIKSLELQLIGLSVEKIKLSPEKDWDNSKTEKIETELNNLKGQLAQKERAQEKTQKMYTNQLSDLFKKREALLSFGKKLEDLGEKDERKTLLVEFLDLDLYEGERREIQEKLDDAKEELKSNEAEMIQLDQEKDKTEGELKKVELKLERVVKVALATAPKSGKRVKSAKKAKMLEEVNKQKKAVSKLTNEAGLIQQAIDQFERKSNLLSKRISDLDSDCETLEGQLVQLSNFQKILKEIQKNIESGPAQAPQDWQVHAPEGKTFSISQLLAKIETVEKTLAKTEQEIKKYTTVCEEKGEYATTLQGRINTIKKELKALASVRGEADKGSEEDTRTKPQKIYHKGKKKLAPKKVEREQAKKVSLELELKYLTGVMAQLPTIKNKALELLETKKEMQQQELTQLKVELGKGLRITEQQQGMLEAKIVGTQEKSVPSIRSLLWFVAKLASVLKGPKGVSWVTGSGGGAAIGLFFASMLLANPVAMVASAALFSAMAVAFVVTGVLQWHGGRSKLTEKQGKGKGVQPSQKGDVLNQHDGFSSSGPKPTHLEGNHQVSSVQSTSKVDGKKQEKNSAPSSPADGP